jgi:hypothetical protein
LGQAEGGCSGQDQGNYALATAYGATFNNLLRSLGEFGGYPPGTGYTTPSFPYDTPNAVPSTFPTWSVQCPYAGTSPYLRSYKFLPVNATYLDIGLLEFIYSGSLAGYVCWELEVFTEDGSPFSMKDLNVTFTCNSTRYPYYSYGTSNVEYFISTDLVNPSLSHCTTFTADDSSGSGWGTQITLYGQTFTYYTPESTLVHYP